MNRTIVMIDWTKPVMRDLPIGPVAKAARTSTSSAMRPSTSGIGVAGRTEALHGDLEQSRDPEEVERPVEEPAHGDVVGRDQRSRRPRARRCPASRAIRSAGNRASSGARKSSRPDATRSAGAAGEGRRSG